jgi:hypothetical protein
MDLAKLITEKRPKLSPSSVKTYASTLSNLFKKVFGSTEMDTKRFDETEKIMTHIKDIPASKRKSILSALVVLTDNKIYKDAMMNDISAHNAVQSKQEQTDKQKENNVSKDELTEIYKDLTNEAKMIFKKTKRSANDFQRIQDYILISLMGGFFIPPRRAMDWTEFKLYNLNETCNHLDKNSLVFNTYKGSSAKGKQTIDIPPALTKILTQWRSISDNDYLLYDLNGSKLNSTKITHRLNKIFGKKYSVNGLRHSYLSNKYGDLIDKKNEMKQDFENMGSSSSQEAVYIKK